MYNNIKTKRINILKLFTSEYAALINNILIQKSRNGSYYLETWLEENIKSNTTEYEFAKLFIDFIIINGGKPNSNLLTPIKKLGFYRLKSTNDIIKFQILAKNKSDYPFRSIKFFYDELYKYLTEYQDNDELYNIVLKEHSEYLETVKNKYENDIIKESQYNEILDFLFVDKDYENKSSYLIDKICYVNMSNIFVSLNDYQLNSLLSFASSHPNLLIESIYDIEKEQDIDNPVIESFINEINDMTFEDVLIKLDKLMNYKENNISSNDFYIIRFKIIIKHLNELIKNANTEGIYEINKTITDLGYKLSEL